MDSQVTTIDLLRHGEARGGSYYRGVTDDPLTELGWLQMHRQCAERQWDVVISSPLRRCQSFASAWCEQQQVPLRVDSAWMEIDFGAWEGKTAAQIQEVSPGSLEAFYRDPIKNPPPQAESYPQFTDRILGGWDRMVRHCEGQRILVVTHGGVIRALFSQILHILPEHSLQIEVNHACLTRFTYYSTENHPFVQLNFHKPG